MENSFPHRIFCIAYLLCHFCGQLSTEIAESCALRSVRGSAVPTAGAKRKGHLRFPFLFELLPFPCFLIWRRFPICDRFEKGNGSRVTAACLSPPFRSSQTAYCYTCGLISAGAAIDRHSPSQTKNAEAGKAIFSCLCCAR